jgi:hypothetical protein
MEKKGWKPTRRDLHRQLDMVLAKAHPELKETVKFVIVAAYKLTIRLCK